jgi:hypothetical protein
MGAWTEIVDYTVPSDTSSFTVNNFGTITKDNFIKVVGTFNSTAAGSIDVQLVANASVTSNYHNQYLIADTSVVSAARSNAAFIQLGRSAQDGMTIGYLKLSENDRLNMLFNDTRVITDGNQLQVNYTYSTSSGATFASGITSLTFTANRNMEAGSRIQIYRLDAEKVADITVASNTTQVDISSLSIGKDSEYLLMSDWLTGNNINCNITPNDATTLTNYYRQTVGGNSTTVVKTRENNPNFVGILNMRAVSYHHIKLSEIGAYTQQSYTIQWVGSTTPLVINTFVSSIAENITSITKLNIFGSGVGATNGISAGSRFTLYKLK